MTDDSYAVWRQWAKDFIDSHGQCGIGIITDEKREWVAKTADAFYKSDLDGSKERVVSPNSRGKNWIPGSTYKIHPALATKWARCRAAGPPCIQAIKDELDSRPQQAYRMVCPEHG